MDVGAVKVSNTWLVDPFVLQPTPLAAVTAPPFDNVKSLPFAAIVLQLTGSEKLTVSVLLQLFVTELGGFMVGGVTSVMEENPPPVVNVNV